MRIIAEVPHPKIKITLFYMNQKYLVKLERNLLEQVYKFSELDYIITDVSDIIKLITPDFIDEVILEFDKMELIHQKIGEQL